MVCLRVPLLWGVDIWGLETQELSRKRLLSLEVGTLEPECLSFIPGPATSCVTLSWYLTPPSLNFHTYKMGS